MKNIWLIILMSPLALTAQYFQQQVDYRINAHLDDKNDVLNAHLELDYTNKAPVSLDTIVFHLWPRAYSSDRTAFAKQQLRDGNTRFHFSSSDERGTMDSLNFQVNGENINWAFDDQHPDIAYLFLKAPLQSGQTITISTPFRVKIPASFSRLGHIGDSYQMTQWYPKPAVYDQEGWHPMPYLDRGEFYSEFGNFDVHITLPKNYIVAATGTLQTEEELNFLLHKAQQDATQLAQRDDLSSVYVNEPFPPSANEVKSLHYVAENVHDFAWFADKRFKVLHMEAFNPATEKRLDFWSFFTETEAKYWQNSLIYLERAIEFYSEKIGLYPYPQVTAVQSALSAGGGMEYPMITVIARNTSSEGLDRILAHEIGHNWFYGILATNERVHPWLDEGFNSYYEGLYMHRWHPEYKAGWVILGKSTDIDLLGYRYQNRLGKMQPPTIDSDSTEAANYWLNAYSKPDLALQHLVTIYGAEAIDKAMQAYFQKWQFKHPQPDDVKAVFEESIGAKLDWFFDGLLQGKGTYDYYFGKGKKDNIVVKHRGDIQVPIIIASRDQPNTERLVLQSIPVDGYDLPSGNYEILAGPLDLYPSNNYTERPLKAGFLTSVEAASGEKHSYLSPLLAANAQNGFMLGVAFHNRSLPPQKLEFLLAPMYGFKSKSLNGFAGLRWRGLSNNTSSFLQSTVIDFGHQRFAYREFREKPYHYNRTALKITFNLQHPPIKQLASGISAQFIGLQFNRPNFSPTGEIIDPASETSYFLRAEYFRKAVRTINPNSIDIMLEYGIPSGPLVDNFLKLEANLKGGYQYQSKKFIRWRLFAGYFIDNSLRDRNFSPNYAFSLVGNAASDYAFDNLYLGRQDDRSYGQQLSQNMGGFRTPIGRAFGFGLSNSYLATVNLDFELPFTPAKFPLGIFLDAGIYDRSPIRASSEAAFQWSGGLSLTFLEGKIGIYAPLVSSPDLNNLLDQRGGLLQQLSFRLSLQDLMPWRWINQLGI